MCERELNMDVDVDVDGDGDVDVRTHLCSVVDQRASKRGSKGTYLVSGPNKPTCQRERKMQWQRNKHTGHRGTGGPETWDLGQGHRLRALISPGSQAARQEP